MKKTFQIFLISVVVVGFLVTLILRSSKINNITNENSVKNKTLIIYQNNEIQKQIISKSNYVPSKEERIKMSNNERIELFEKLGFLPFPSDYRDYACVEQTSWWGKRLDPVEFWKDRVVWYDGSAESAAKRKGRAYPPIPYDDPSVSDRNDDDIKNKAFFRDGTQPNYVYSERESIFWSIYRMKNLCPPKDIENWLGGLAESWIYNKYNFENYDPNPSKGRVTPKMYKESMESKLDKTNIHSFPPEAVSPEAFHWDYVMRKRAEYDKYIDLKLMDNERIKESFFNKVYVDRELITEPLTEAQIDAANAWKVAYLNRLRNEKWDESYINAYLEAWNLTEEYVFGDKTKTLND